MQEYLSSTRYCFGAGIAVHLVPSKILDRIVLSYLSLLTEASIKAIDVGACPAWFVRSALLHPCFRYQLHGLAQNVGPRPFVLIFHELTLLKRGHGIPPRHALELRGNFDGAQG